MIVAMVLISCSAGYIVYNRSTVDEMRPVDAIVVLGGERDGREDYAFDLARQGLSRNVVLSDPYGRYDTQMAARCGTHDPHFTVRCIPPNPGTTLGEAIFTRNLAIANGWKSLLVITWRYHLPRARYIFSHCLNGRDVSMLPVPRTYSAARWAYQYFYQSAGFLKAFVQDPSSTCDGSQPGT
ncbi:YdcF family protein [Rhodococcus koreensis]|uniref:YdcF family protein n=1 Tax=Rhodococcus koreensis TaxID=99653 RepID=UPI0036DDB6E3